MDVSTVQLSPGWATFGLPLEQGQAFSGLQVAPLATQTDVKARWPDGSIRFAVLTVHMFVAGTFPISNEPSKLGPDFDLIPPDVAVELSTAQGLYTATLPVSPCDDRWLEGPLVVEWRCVITPRSKAGLGHDQLRVIFDTRLYQDGQTRLDVTVENVIDALPATSVDYSVRVLAGGKEIYQHPTLTHRWLARWRRTFDLDLQASRVTPDFEQLAKTHALPVYWSDLPKRPLPIIDASAFDLLELGGLMRQLGNASPTGIFAPYPHWVAQYAVERGQELREYTLAQGEQAASWPVHLREPEAGSYAGLGSGRLLSIDERPYYWFDSRAPFDGPAGPVCTGYCFPADQNIPVAVVDKQPSLAFVPYLLTGDRYFAEELAFWANFALLSTTKSDQGEGAEGLWLGRYAESGVAWATRDLADAAAFLPDTWPEKAYFEEKLRNNLADFDRYAKANPTALGHTLAYEVAVQGQRYGAVSLGDGYGPLAWAIQHANRLGFPGGGALRDRLSSFVIKLATSEPEFPRQYSSGSTLLVGVPAATPSASKPFNYFSTLAALKAANEAYSVSHNFNHRVRLAFLVGLENGLPDAQAAYDYNHGLALGAAEASWVKMADAWGWAVMPQIE